MELDKMGKFLAKLRKEKQLTQQELGDKLNVDNKTISKWENGVTAPDTETLIELTHIYDVRVEEIVKGEKISKRRTNRTKE